MGIHKNLLGSLIVIGALCAWGMVLLPVQASPATLPPRYATPTVTPASAPTVPAAAPKGAAIVLELTFGEGWHNQGMVWQELWTVVEWQDAGGAWHAVEGWQGSIGKVDGNTGWTTWRLEKNLFGQGPFRWVVYAHQDGPVLAHSQPFDLPGQTGKTVTVAVSLVP